jgi:thioredoxin 1
MADIPAVTDSDFDEKVLKSDKPVLVDFSATWCAPCKQLAPIIADLAEELKGQTDVYGVDVNDSPDTAQKYGVMAVPTLIVFKDGEEKAREAGFMPKARIMDLIGRAS